MYKVNFKVHLARLVVLGRVVWKDEVVVMV